MKKTEKNKYLPYGRQHIDANDIQEVVSVLESDYLTTGKKTIDFEIEFSKNKKCEVITLSTFKKDSISKIKAKLLNYVS